MARILVVDDDLNFRTVLRSLLEREGHTVREAADGHAAEQADAESPADILILDVHMPQRDGIETLRSFKTRGRPAKIVMTSGGCHLCQIDYLPIVSRLGADATLAKPFQREELLQTLSDLLSDRAP